MNQQEKIEKLAKGLMEWHHWKDPLGREPDDLRWWEEGNKYRVAEANWNPYESWNDTGMIVEKMNSEHKLLHLFQYPSPDDLSLITVADFSGFGAVEANTILEAICEAALKTLEVKMPGSDIIADAIEEELQEKK